MYTLHDPNDRELTALIHDNRLIETTIQTMNELKELWASPRAKNISRKRNKRVKIFPSYPENVDILDEHL